MDKPLYACFFPLKEGRKRVVWEVTYRCNAECAHCCTESGPTKGLPNELTVEEIIAKLEEFKKMGVNEVYFSGGEPLIKKGFLDLLKYSRKNFLNVVFSTNGALVDERMAQELARIQPDYVGISIDSHDEKVHDDFRRMKGLWRKACAGIQNLSKYDVKVRINHVIMSFNYTELERMVHLAIKLDADGVLFNFLLPMGRTARDDPLSPPTEKIPQIIEHIKELKEKYEEKQGVVQVMFRRFFTDELKAVEGCQGGTRLFYVTPDGKVGPCPIASKMDRSYVGGNLREASVRDIQNLKPFKDFLKMVKDRRKKVGACQRCTLLKTCGQGCPAAGLSYKESLYEMDPVCVRGRQFPHP